MNDITITKTTVFVHSPKRVDDRRNRRYCIEFPVSFIYSYEYDKEVTYEREAERLAARLAQHAAQSCSKRQERFDEIAGAIFDFCRETLDPQPKRITYRRDVNGSTYTRAGSHEAFVAFNFSVHWAKPSQVPDAAEFLEMREALGARLMPEAERTLADALEVLRQELEIEQIAHNATWLTEAVRDEANKRAREACRFDQRLAALEAEYCAEFALQVDKIMDDDTEWQEVREHDASDEAVNFVRERRAEIRKQHKLGLVRGATRSRGQVSKEEVQAFVAARNIELI